MRTRTKKKILVKKRIYQSKFKGISLDVFFGIIYLILKYKNSCVLLSNFEKYNNYDTYLNDVYIKWSCSFGKFTLQFPKNYFNNFYNCNKRFIITPIFIGDKSCNNVGHLNFLIIDKSKNPITIERFEPYGGDRYYLEKKFDDSLKKSFEKKIGKIKYFSPPSFCPIIGQQQQEENNLENRLGTSASLNDIKGYCGAWGLWYGNLRLKNPDIKPKDLLEYSMNKLNKYPHSYRTFIRSYSNFIVEQRKKILKKIDPKCDNLENYCAMKFINLHLNKLLKKNISL